MSYAIVYAREAVADLDSIFDYISVELENPIAAIRTTDKIQAEIRTLSEMPSRFRLHVDPEWAARGVHVMVVGHFQVYYLIDDSKSVVSIVRIMFERQGYPDPSFAMVAEPRPQYNAQG